MTARCRPAAALVAGLGLVSVVLAGCSSGWGSGSGAGEDAAALSAPPSPHCADDGGDYDALRAYLSEHAADEPWIDRVLVCAGGTVQVDQTGMGADDAAHESLDVCAVAAGYL